jgi:hypothetical protein
VNALGTDQPEQLIFTDRCGRPIGDVEIPGVMDFEEEDDDNAVMPVLDPVGVDGVELPGVDVAGQAPQTVEIDDLDIPQPDPPLIETVEEPTYPKWSKMNQHRLHNQWKLQGCKDQRESRFSPNCTNRQ